MALSTHSDYQQLLEQISTSYGEARLRAVQAVNQQLVASYWQVGQHIVEFEQGGQSRAVYGKDLINQAIARSGFAPWQGF
ncbi:DUF1016 N-terminal domain-containing protein [Iodobacter ciconiae]|uniref:DUF1016 N-terminal domain-containing protein n=1 Tax=Iodobacter ciconiae TaxID=2496266 RepID=UPI0019D1248A|nr:DUF1016 N-terminal domain-containing protein [Iodobacter ciconiae]